MGATGEDGFPSYELRDCVELVMFVKQKTAYELRISDWSSDVCSTDLAGIRIDGLPGAVIGGVEDQGVLVETQLAHLVHDASDAGVELHNAVGVLGLRQRLVDRKSVV